MTSELQSFLFGRLTWSDFVHDPIMAASGYMMVFGLLAIVAGVTYKKKWGWLLKNWLTALDPKKIGIMFLFASSLPSINIFVLLYFVVFRVQLLYFLMFIHNCPFFNLFSFFLFILILTIIIFSMLFIHKKDTSTSITNTHIPLTTFLK